MNTRELENALLLRDSGELAPEQLRELENALTTQPELAALAEEMAVLQQAGPFSSSRTVPPLSDLQREKILQQAPAPTRTRITRLLALAALFILGLSLLPHLTRHLDNPAPVVTAIEPIRADLESEDPILSSLEKLENELTVWTAVEMKDTAFLEDESDWAETLLHLEDAI